MIVAYHSDNKIIEVQSSAQNIDFDANQSIAVVLQRLAVQFPEEIIAWCHIEYKPNLNIEAISSLFHHNKMLLSYNPNGNFLNDALGYVEDSLFVNVKKDVRYATWQMSSIVGVIHTSVLLAAKKIKPGKDFDYYLNSVAKIAMPLGLLCYSEPRLLKNQESHFSPKADNLTLFRFVKQHYKVQWIFLLLLNFMMYQKRFPMIAMISALFYKSRTKIPLHLEGIEMSFKDSIAPSVIDVIIPTIGRKKYLYDFLSDLKQQTFLPSNVIIVEQNPMPGSVSELEYLTEESWPFTIKHTFTQQAGVCNARNLALDQITGEWVFFADDDIRIEPDFIQKTILNIHHISAKAVSIACFQKGEKPLCNTIFQWVGFGSGCSFVLAESLKDCRFSTGYEFGFGEDGDFGMQLRNQGCDVLYLPQPFITHLKAPIGGFRTKPVLRWQTDVIQPKPSPTVMLFLLEHRTKQQLFGYKTTLFFKYYKRQKTKNPIQYYNTFQDQWMQSLHWANVLKNEPSL
ncbi:glycosyltransferase family 2 protein [Flavobacterium sp. GT3R68]|uniref:glycosyltransferase family 2 protein n=1 Tax=Flavobacterium sp. GT3R68 TaxID=2594437 RepID=UPI000F892625|nr:glycosyltransferase family A protein [Flavobacterium sp. GT3R68]RTY92251.1 glycosyltransferase family 2 protein [Flavobacterium sp. GSN2]TRW92487.1 glycosyltransferase family 2 protein [Flavobacterium sp. GT3R68]